MTTPIQTSLNAFTFPLHGSRLIEASAGTGKTYTIANLYLRIILGHGDDSSRHCQPLTVDQILVVTFTEAATGELRDRVRSRIHDARMAFIKGSSEDDDIQRLINELDQHDQCIELLLTAERQMDEAAIFTIHGFCQRMLKQHAFESGTLFTSELVSDIEHLLQTSVADYWRKHLYPLSKPMAALVREKWTTPEALLSQVRGWLSLSTLTMAADNLPDSLADYGSVCLQPWLDLKEAWKQDHQTINDLLTNSDLAKNKKPYKRIGKMNAFVHSPDLLTDRENWEAFSTTSLSTSVKKNGTPPEHPIFHTIDEVLTSAPEPKQALKAIVLRDAFGFIKHQFNALKADKHQFSFDDLLSNLATALQKDVTGTLSGAIRQQFRIAMIDEFQDTDPLQYDIFKRIYVETNDQQAGLFMIGDPKQAIYAFRGADIFTYMQARQQVLAHYNLDTNWRSTEPMVEAVNVCFEQSGSPFIYEDAIPFHPVKASSRAGEKQLLNNDNPVPAMTLWLDDNGGEPTKSGRYLDVMTAATAEEIKHLLTAADKNQCVIRKKEKTAPVQPGDIAVLVRTGHQGKMVRDALSKQGIASIYLSNNDSVFTCQEAIDMQRILHACLTPTSERALKAALASGLLHQNAVQLDALNVEEEKWEAAVKEFTDYQKIWLSQGVLPMLRTLMSQRGVSEQLLACEFGERRLTDLLHLGQLLSSASQTMESPHALIRWLGEQIENPDSNADDQQLHLESERNLVKIVTIHKSKGLEYNIVFLPFICSCREADSPLYHDESNGTAVLDLTYSDDSLVQADKERLAEDLRLLYVALTRSVHRCYMGIAPFRAGGGKSTKTELHLTAIGYLLNKGDVIEAADLRGAVETLASASPYIEISDLPEVTTTQYQPPKTVSPELNARTFNGHITKNWWVTSYSALSRHSHGGSGKQIKAPSSPDASMESAGLDTEDQNEPDGVMPEEEFNLFQFPRGARPGTFMHTLFEQLDMESARSGDISDYVKEQLAKEGYEEHWAPALEQMLMHCLTAPLDGKSMQLINIPDSARCVEMEFYLPITELNDQALNRLIKQHDKLSGRAGMLEFSQVRGMLKGFIDLTFEYQGRWYVLDYKSNWLGEQTSDYSRDSMEHMMIDHRYDLQYQLYSLALHRLLKQRVPDYDFQQHFGGVIYLFLRGVQSNNTLSNTERHGIYDHRPSQELIEQLDALFAGNKESGSC